MKTERQLIEELAEFFHGVRPHTAILVLSRQLELMSKEVEGLYWEHDHTMRDMEAMKRREELKKNDAWKDCEYRGFKVQAVWSDMYNRWIPYINGQSIDGNCKSRKDCIKTAKDRIDRKLEGQNGTPKS